MLEYPQNYGAASLDQQEDVDRIAGWAVVPASLGGALNTECEVTIDTGTLGTNNNAIQVDSGYALVDGAVTKISQQSLDISSGDSNPRKDVVYIDSNGSPTKKEGTAASVPSEAPGDTFKTWKPAPYSMHDIDGTVLAEVWVAANASSIGSGDLRDRRLPADIVLNAVTSQVARTNSTVDYGDLRDSL